MYIHLLFDAKFAKSQIGIFEKYHPNLSLYIITQGGNTQTEDEDNIIFLDNLNIYSLKKVTDRCIDGIDGVFVYNASYNHRLIALYLKMKYGCKIYWMFFGNELYSNLYYRYNYHLIDDEHKSASKFLLDKLRMIKHWPLFKRFAKKVDYFCFWNIYDFELLKKYVKTHASFKFYTHGFAFSLDESYSIKNNNDSELIVQVNHSASWDGNHVSVLKRLVEIDPERKLKLLIPLSYGEDYVIKEVEDFVADNNLNAQLIKDFLRADVYFKLMSRVNVFILGAHRQEGGGNLLHAFKNGTKVFLRDDNNLLNLYQDCGIKVFSFERDLNRLEDLTTPLSFEDQRNNFYKIQELFSMKKVEESMRHFLT